MIMHQSSGSLSALFYSIETVTGHRISLTSNHFLAVEHEDRFLPASKVQPRDTVFIQQNGRLHAAIVRNITEEYKIGYVTPMTGHGNHHPVLPPQRTPSVPG